MTALQWVNLWALIGTGCIATAPIWLMGRLPKWRPEDLWMWLALIVCSPPFLFILTAVFMDMGR